MYLARELTKSSLNEIGDAFGGRDHGTVLHAHRLVKTAHPKTRKRRARSWRCSTASLQSDRDELSVAVPDSNVMVSGTAAESSRRTEKAFLPPTAARQTPSNLRASSRGSRTASDTHLNLVYDWHPRCLSRYLLLDTPYPTAPDIRRSHELLGDFPAPIPRHRRTGLVTFLQETEKAHLQGRHSDPRRPTQAAARFHRA